ncbi:hypothetical protein AREALGSMS7_01956 [Arenibacter algicola]|jgi:succinate dehydrogenase/fumarate reductase cytochrome b subunit|uniref:Uncharacterized protein n=1 Tax=Arenibacter algicola TaxID=616991 RepID=A0A221UW64_9FLAO|nr:hypothetical protein AREALGSMS7_01956 [Arenibacter algicola]
MNLKELEMLGGIFCLTISILLGYREYLNWKSIKKDDYILKSFSIQKLTGIIIFFIAGVLLVYGYFSDFFTSI